MKTLKRTVYYCDFCKKKLMRIDSMASHELGCTNNPDRDCRMCKNTTKEMLQKGIAILLDTEKQETDDIMGQALPKELRLLLGDCPACLLASLRQSDKSGFNFDYQAERRLWWEENPKMWH